MTDIETAVKACGLCGVPKSVGEFYRRAASRDGLAARCKVCSNAVVKKWQKDNPERAGATRAAWVEANRGRVNVIQLRHIAKKYGMTLEAWHSLLVAQSGRCAVCVEPMESPHVDHDHACCPGDGSCGDCVRGLLCKHCNSGLGLFRDDLTRLAAAAAYLEGHR